MTIRQPWATLIAEGLKEYEFRTWNTKYRGDLLIHAGKGVDKEAIKRFSDYNLEYPTGCIIAKVRLTDSEYVNDEFVNRVASKNALVYRGIIDKGAWSGYGFKLENVEKIDPIYINGKLGLWDYDYKENK